MLLRGDVVLSCFLVLHAIMATTIWQVGFSKILDDELDERGTFAR